MMGSLYLVEGGKEEGGEKNGWRGGRKGEREGGREGGTYRALIQTKSLRKPQGTSFSQPDSPTGQD